MVTKITVVKLFNVVYTKYGILYFVYCVTCVVCDSVDSGIKAIEFNQL